MADLFDNPMGLAGFEFVEFASPAPNVLEPLFEKMGFSLVARHRSKDVLLFRQGGINFIVNREPKSLAGYFAAEHGPSACALAFRVRDSHKAYARALELGAQPIDVPTGPMELRLPAVKGIGGAPLYLIDRYEDGKSIYDIDFEFLPAFADPASRHPRGHGAPQHRLHRRRRPRALPTWAAMAAATPIRRGTLRPRVAGARRAWHAARGCASPRATATRRCARPRALR
jgi:4-hydroxyphenylpyruvate dioxygenase